MVFKGRGIGKRFVTLVSIAASVMGVSVLAAGSASAQPTIARCLSEGQPFSYARSKPDHNLVGNRPYYISVESLLYGCGGWVAAKHIVHLDSRWLAPGTAIHLRISTKRSDGRWVGADRTIVAKKNFSDETYYQLRGTGRGTYITNVHVKHFAEPGQTSIFPLSTAKAAYGPWNGPQASPRK